MKIHRRLNKNYIFKKQLIKKRDKSKDLDDQQKEKIKNLITAVNRRINRIKDKLYNEFTLNVGIRSLREECLSKRNVISVFDSTLTRTLGMKENEISLDIMVVQTYFFDILKDVILNGFRHNDEKYVCFTASAGQIRTKKTVFIKESILKQHQNTLMCGLAVDKINAQGGVNVNKYLAYLALCNSATDEWKDFDINKTIVVDDLETNVRSIVDFIDDKTYEIERKEMDIPINHTDGCGMILPSKSKKSAMVRLPWIKGLLVPFPFDKFIKTHNSDGIVTDIYGRQHNIIEDDIQVILTKSQFKMWKYYSSWDEYKENYLKYNCQAGKCNEEEDVIGNAKLNYQMLQTLTDITDKELIEISNHTKSQILSIGRDRKTMLKVLGVTESNLHKNYLQQALEIYPELLGDTYSKEILKQVKKSMVRDARAGKIDINGKYAFICPDLYAFCEFLILGNKQPNGLLGNGEVYCSLYRNENKLDCLRSPHLYREHAVRVNVVDREKSKWFITKGLYTSVHDPISKILMFDVDGDKSLVCADHTIINVAERNMKDIVPLFYNMAKAAAENVDNRSIYAGLKTAYTGGNIGAISNNITKIWNSDDVNLDVIKWLCAENNFVIDFAKTLYKPERPSHIGKLIKKYTSAKTPHFFIFAKDKNKKNVEKSNSSVVNKLEKLIPNTRIDFSASNLGKFNYKMLMSKKTVKLDQAIIDKYMELDLKKRFIEIDSLDDSFASDNLSVYRDIRTQILKINNDVEYVVDVLIKFLYNYKKSNHKTTLWSSFGDMLIGNIKNNIRMKLDDGHTLCIKCGKRVEITNNRKKYCDECFKIKHKELDREYQRKKYNSRLLGNDEKPYKH